MKIIDKGEFVAVGPNAKDEIFVVYISALVELITMLIHPFHQAQIVLLMSKKTGIYTEYSNFSNVLSYDSAAELLEYTKLIINLLDNKQLSYGPIYSLGLVELKTLKTYIDANLASSFIRSSKFTAGIPIQFVQKKTVGSFFI